MPPISPEIVNSFIQRASTPATSEPEPIVDIATAPVEGLNTYPDAPSTNPVPPIHFPSELNEAEERSFDAPPPSIPQIDPILEHYQLPTFTNPTI